MKCCSHGRSITRDYSKVSSKACTEGQLNEGRDPRGIDASPSSLHEHLLQCISRKDLLEGRKVHSLLAGIGYESNAHVGSYLIRLYVLCGSLIEANRVFSKVYKPNVYAWSEILLANVKDGESKRAVQMYGQMHLTCVKPDKCVYVAVLKACAWATALGEGRHVHSDIIRSGLEQNVYLISALIDMYAKCSSLRDACEVFEGMPSDDVVVWNAMVAGLSLHGHCTEALQLLQQMQQEGPQPNNRTWTAVLAGYSEEGHDKDASQLFQQMSYEGLEPNTVTWNALLRGLVHHEQSHDALSLYYHLIHEGIAPDKITHMYILKACADMVDLQRGRLIHDQIINNEEPNIAVETTLIDMYAKCGSLEDSQNLFERLQVRDVVVYNSLIAGYLLHDFTLDALNLFYRMQKESVMSDNVTLLSVIKVCTLVSAAINGKLVHGMVIEDGADRDEFISTSLIDMYVECGSFKDAFGVFDKLSKVDITAWNALIVGHAIQSDYPSVYKTLEQMQIKGLIPDGVTFVSLLCACISTGAVEEGANLFNSMRETYGISPREEHCGCMVELLGNAGCLIEAEDLMHVFPLAPKIVPWTSLLNSCREHNNVELAEYCFEHIIDIDECCPYAYIIMSKVYSNADMLDDVIRLKTMRESSNNWKVPGKAFIEVDGVVHGFVVKDGVHLQVETVYEKLAALNTRLKHGGHVWHAH